jgi:aconitate hydratase
MGIVPLQYNEGDSAESLGLTGTEKLSVILPENPGELKPRQAVTVKVEDTGKNFQVLMRFDTELELTYYKNGGILNYMIRKVVE